MASFFRTKSNCTSLEDWILRNEQRALEMFILWKLYVSKVDFSTFQGDSALKILKVTHCHN